MKKYIFMVFALITGLTSCTNDDITIGQGTNFKINPAGVIAPFTYEINDGELESFSNDHKLRIRLLIYNSKGILVEEETQYFANYTSLMNSTKNLPNGDYTAVAISDVVEYDGINVGTEYWILSEHTNLSETTITDAGLIGLHYKILGCTSSKFTIRGESSEDIVMNITPAGALICAAFMHMDAYTGIELYGLEMNRSSDHITFDNNGNYESSIQNNNGSYDWWLGKSYAEFVNDYDYYFILPMNNVGFRYVYGTENDNTVLTDPIVMSAKAGEEYLFYLDLNNDKGKIEYGCELVNTRTKSNIAPKAIISTQFTKNHFDKKQRIQLKNLLK